MANEMEIKRWLDRHSRSKEKKNRWHELFQYCGEFVHGKKMNFQTQKDQGMMLNHDVFDSTAIKANRKMAASLIGLLWGNGGKSVRISPPRKLINNKEVQEFYEWMTEEAGDYLDDPKAGLSLALEEYMVDQGAFGTSGVGVFDGGKDAALRFKAWGIDEITIEEGANGYVRTIFREFEIPLSTAVADYGLENFSPKVKQMWNDGKTQEMVKLLHIIAPRDEKKTEAGNRAMDFMSLVIEVDAKKEVMESGFPEMPVPISRFFKRNNETYGRSPAMDALPDILEINATKEARISAIEKSLDPPLGVFDDATLGNEKIDTSSRAINVFKHTSKLGNRNPVFPLFTVETIREADKSIMELRESINEHFNIDRLLDFNNTTSMTLGEAQMRNRIRSESLGSLFNRQINELFTPMVERAIAILYRKGLLGVIKGSPEEQAAIQNGKAPRVIPDPVAELITSGEDFYQLEYVTPAARMLETEEAEGVMRTWEFAGTVAGMKGDPSVFDILDADESVKIVGRNVGTPTKTFTDEESVKQIREAKAQAAQKQAQLAAMQQGGDALTSLGGGAEKIQKVQQQNQ